MVNNSAIVAELSHCRILFTGMFSKATQNQGVHECFTEHKSVYQCLSNPPIRRQGIIGPPKIDRVETSEYHKNNEVLK